MSRSYKKIGGYGIAGGSDKWNRSRYHRDERRKVKAICHNVEKWYERDYKLESLDGELDEVASDYNWCDLTNFGENNIPYNKYMDEVYYPDWMIYFDSNNITYEWEIEAEKIVMNKVDRSLGSADKYCWASDGGSYFRDDLSSMRQEFDEEVFGIPTHSWRYRRGLDSCDLWYRYCDNREALHNKKHPQMVIYCSYRVKKTCPLRGTADWIDWRLAYGEVYDHYTRTIKVPYNRAHYYDTGLLLKGLDKGAEVEKVDVYKQKDWAMRQIRSCRWDLGDYIIKMAPTSLHGPKDFLEWIRAHQEELILGAFRYRYGK